VSLSPRLPFRGRLSSVVKTGLPRHSSVKSSGKWPPKLVLLVFPFNLSDPLLGLPSLARDCSGFSPPQGPPPVDYSPPEKASSGVPPLIQREGLGSGLSRGVRADFALRLCPSFRRVSRSALLSVPVKMKSHFTGQYSFRHPHSGSSRGRLPRLCLLNTLPALSRLKLSVWMPLTHLLSMAPRDFLVTQKAPPP